jgi:hypothetical protein
MSFIKTTMNYCDTPTKMPQSKPVIASNAGADVEQQDSHSLLDDS